jgi:hypothetical protein
MAKIKDFKGVDTLSVFFDPFEMIDNLNSKSKDKNNKKTLQKNKNKKWLYVFVDEVSSIVWKISARTDLNLQQIIEIMEAGTKRKFIQEVLLSLKSYDSSTFKDKLREWLEENGNNPALTRSPLSLRKKLGISSNIRNIITGTWIDYLSLKESDSPPTDIKPEWSIEVNN